MARRRTSPRPRRGCSSACVAATAIPLSLWAPTRLAKSADPRGLLFAIIGCYLVGYVGLLVAPHDGAVAWALLIGAGTTTFPLVLTLVGLRARTPEGTAALSSVTQSLGYLIAAAGPFSFGALHDATGGWTWPLVVLHRAGAAAVRARRVRRTGRSWSRTSSVDQPRSRNAVSCSSVIPPDAQVGLARRRAPTSRWSRTSRMNSAGVDWCLRQNARCSSSSILASSTSM